MFTERMCEEQIRFISPEVSSYCVHSSTAFAARKNDVSFLKHISLRRLTAPVQKKLNASAPMLIPSHHFAMSASIRQLSHFLRICGFCVHISMSFLLGRIQDGNITNHSSKMRRWRNAIENAAETFSFLGSGFHSDGSRQLTKPINEGSSN